MTSPAMILAAVVILASHSDASILPSLFSTRAKQPILAILSCNNSEAHKLLPQYLSLPSISGSGESYLNHPTILSHKNPNPFLSLSSELELEAMDFGSRIRPLFQQHGMRHPPWTTHRHPFQQNPLLTNMIEDQVQKTMELDNNVRFWLFTRRNPVVGQELKIGDSVLLNQSHFAPELKSVLVFHGFTDVDAPGEWVNGMKESVLAAADVNLLVSDFSSFPLSHLRLSSSLPLLAARRLADFLTFLTQGQNETEAGGLGGVQVIARSFATHVAGLTGRQLGGKLGRITALEPAEKLLIGTTEQRLQKGDAAFVDVVHVNGQRFFFHGPQFGLSGPMGDVDVYPHISEKGLGCPPENLHFRRHSSRHCHLGRGVKYFMQSLRNPDIHPLCKCPSFEVYKAGGCLCSQREAVTSLGKISNLTEAGVYQLAPPQFRLPLNPTPNLLGLMGYQF